MKIDHTGCGIVLALMLIASSGFAPMHKQQPNMSGPPPLPQAPAPRPPRPRVSMNWGNNPAMPAKTNWLTLTNLTMITVEGHSLICVSKEDLRSLVEAYPEDTKILTLRCFKER